MSTNDDIHLRSERLGKTGAEGLRAKEGVMINKSLLTLGTVINKLSEGVHVQGTPHLGIAIARQSPAVVILVLPCDWVAVTCLESSLQHTGGKLVISSICVVSYEADS